MATTLIDNFSLYGDKPNFARDRVENTDEMLNFDVTTKKYDYGHIVFCVANGKHYRFMYNYNAPPSESEKDADTGWFKEFVTGEGGGGGVVVRVVTEEQYAAIENKNDGVLYAILEG